MALAVCCSLTALATAAWPCGRRWKQMRLAGRGCMRRHHHDTGIYRLLLVWSHRANSACSACGCDKMDKIKIKGSQKTVTRPSVPGTAGQKPAGYQAECGLGARGRALFGTSTLALQKLWRFRLGILDKGETHACAHVAVGTGSWEPGAEGGFGSSGYIGDLDYGVVGEVGKDCRRSKSRCCLLTMPFSSGTAIEVQPCK